MCKVEVVKFYEDELYLVSKDGEPFVPVKPVAENLGLFWQTQCRKLLQDARRWQAQTIKVKAQDGKLREMLCLPLRKLPAWLMSISPSKVKPEIRDKLLRYQEECDKVLWDYWFKGQAVNPRKRAVEERLIPDLALKRSEAERLWLFPLSVLADALRVHPYEIVKRLKDEDLFRDEKLAEAVARMHGPEFGLPLFVRDSGLRRLFADVDRDEIEAEVLDKVLRAFERLEARSLSLKVALKIIAAREAGYTYEEIACALGLSDDKVRRLERDLRSINFWKMAKEKLLPRKMLASPAV